MFLDHGLNGVAEKLADDVFKMGDDVGECGG